MLGAVASPQRAVHSLPTDDPETSRLGPDCEKHFKPWKRETLFEMPTGGLRAGGCDSNACTLPGTGLQATGVPAAGWRIVCGRSAPLLGPRPPVPPPKAVRCRGGPTGVRVCRIYPYNATYCPKPARCYTYQARYYNTPALLGTTPIMLGAVYWTGARVKRPHAPGQAPFPNQWHQLRTPPSPAPTPWPTVSVCSQRQLTALPKPPQRPEGPPQEEGGGGGFTRNSSQNAARSSSSVLKSWSSNSHLKTSCVEWSWGYTGPEKCLSIRALVVVYSP